MSYDILVFDPAHAPREREAFLQWWHAQAEWSEPHPYNDPAFTTPALLAWFMDMIVRFPALSGPYAGTRDQRSAAYCIGYHLIYVAISFDKQATHERAHELAGTHHLGLFEASSPDGEIWLPGVGNELVLASKHSRVRNQQPVTDARIAALIGSRSHVGSVVITSARAENPSRGVTVVYIARDPFGGVASLPGGRMLGGLVQLESALKEAGIVYAVLDNDEQAAFLRQLYEALECSTES